MASVIVRCVAMETKPIIHGHAVATVLGIWGYLIGSDNERPDPRPDTDAVQPYERPACLPVKVLVGTAIAALIFKVYIKARACLPQIMLLLGLGWLSAFLANLALAVLPSMLCPHWSSAPAMT